MNLFCEENAGKLYELRREQDREPSRWQTGRFQANTSLFLVSTMEIG